jgi:hypothetical protein
MRQLTGSLFMVVALLAGGPPASAATTSPWRQTVPTTDEQVTAVWMNADHQVHVWDDDVAVPVVAADAPAACEPFPAVGDGWAGFLCNDPAASYPPIWRVMLLSLGDGTWHGVADPAPLSRDTSSGQIYPTATGLGRRAIAVSISGDGGSFDRRYSIDSGRRLPDLANTRQLVDLDAADGRTTLCSPLRVRRNRVVGKVGTYLAPIPATYRPPYLVTWNFNTGSVALSRCGASRQQRIGASTVAPVFTDRYVAWGSGATLSVRTSRTRTVQRFHVSGSVSGVVGTRRRLWVTASHPDGTATTTLVDLDGGGPQPAEARNPAQED